MTTMTENICDKLRKYTKGEIIAYVTILGETVPISRDEALMIFGCHPSPCEKGVNECQK